MATVLLSNMPEDATAFLHELRVKSGLSLSAIVAALLYEAERRGWSVGKSVTVTERSDI
jgi:hypothetical protein